MTLTAARSQQGDPAEGIAFGEGVADKLIAFHGQGGLLTRTPANVLNLYGLLRLGALNGLYDAFVDRHLAFYAACGPAPAGASPQIVLAAWPARIACCRGITGTDRKVWKDYACACVRPRKIRQNPAGLTGRRRRHQPGQPGWPAAGCAVSLHGRRGLADDALFDTAAGLAADAADLLRDSRTGFYHHAGRREGGDGSRRMPGAAATGCAAAVMAELLLYLPAAHPAQAGLIERLRDLLERLAAVQTPSGLWRQQLIENSSREERCPDRP